jgi:hypothetical protein
MNIEIIPSKSQHTISANSMNLGEIGKVCGVSSDDLYLFCISGHPARFIKIWPDMDLFEFVDTIPDSWTVTLLPEGTVVKITSN